MQLVVNLESVYQVKWMFTLEWYDFRILWKKNEVADYEATTYSIFYNNALFLTIVILSSFYLLRTFTPTVYPFKYETIV